MTPEQAKELGVKVKALEFGDLIVNEFYAETVFGNRYTIHVGPDYWIWAYANSDVYYSGERMDSLEEAEAG